MSSSSYHGFAGIMDTGFMGLFVAIGFRSRTNYIEQPGTEGRWGTILSTETASNELLMITYLASFAVAGLHLMSIIMDTWLCFIYRKISKLPPDMNPLEDDLTTRRRAKHKYKNSSVSHLLDKPTINTPGSRASDISAKRRSHVNVRESLISDAGTQMSFFGSRADQDVGYSPHNPRTAARWSQVNLGDDMYKQPGSARQSRISLHLRDSLIPDVSPADGRRVSPLPADPSMSKRHSAASIPRASGTGTNIDPPGINHESKPPSREDLQNDNWFVLGTSDTSSINSYDPYKYSASTKDITASPRSKKSARSSHQTRAYEPIPRYEDDTFIHQPLGMNPPTPPPQPFAPRSPSKPLGTRDSRYYLDQSEPQFQEEKENRSGTVSPLHPSDATIPDERTTTMRSAVSALTEGSHYSQGTDADDCATDAGETVLSATTGASQTVVSSMHAFGAGGAPPKGRFFGDLNSALRGVRQVDRMSEGPRSMVGSIHGMSDVGSTVGAGMGRPHRSGKGWVPPENWNANGSLKGSTPRANAESVSGTVVRKDGRDRRRVVSRSGADEGDLGLSGGSWMGRKREVSGKVVEEGRGGWKGGLYLRKISGNNQSRQ